MGFHADRKVIIEVTPTLRTDEYAQNDCLFNKVEIPKAVLENNGCSKLVNITVTSEKAAWKEIDVAIFENNQSLEAAGDALAVSAADGTAAKMCGWINLPAAGNLDLGNFTFSNAVPAVGEPQLPFLIQAAAGSTSCYFIAILRGTAETFGADDLTFRFHLEY